MDRLKDEKQKAEPGTGRGAGAGQRSRQQHPLVACYRVSVGGRLFPRLG